MRKRSLDIPKITQSKAEPILENNENIIINSKSKHDFIFLLHNLKISKKFNDYFKIPILETLTFLKGTPYIFIFNREDVRFKNYE